MDIAALLEHPDVACDRCGAELCLGIDLEALADSLGAELAVN